MSDETPKTNSGNPAPTSADSPATSSPPSASGAPPAAGTPVDLKWVWIEVRKRVFIKLPFSLGVADAMEAVVPIILEGDTFVCGMTGRDFPLASHLQAHQVRNTIENILRQAAGRYIHFEIIEGTTLEDWNVINDRRKKAQDAVVAMAEQSVQTHHFEDVLNQIVGELRGRITGTRERALPQVRARLLLDIVPSLADAEEMLFPDPDAHEAKRAMSRAFDRVASFLEVPPLTLAIEVERYRRDMHHKK